MPFPFLLVALLIASTLLGELFRPKPVDTAKAASLKDFSVPTAEQSRSIPVVWGTVLVDQPNVIWYGDLQSVKLTKKVKTGLFSSSRLTIGFRYSLGMQLAFCHGLVDALLEVRTNDKTAFSGNILGDTVNGTDFTVDARTIYGGDSEEQMQNGGEGGVYAACTFYNGSGSQNANSYMSSILSTSVPAHRGISYLLWKGPSSGSIVYNYDLGNPLIKFTREPFLSGYIGTSPNMKPLSFVIKRLPNLINGSYYNISGDANPVDVILELLTNDDWGMGLSTAFIDLTSFQYAQQYIFNEGLGFSGIWDSPKQISEIIEEVANYIDAVLYVDLETGLVTIKLARNDYDINNILQLDEDNVVEVVNFSRPSWDETTNEIVLTYIDRFAKFKEKTIYRTDIANQRIQGDIISNSISYLGISNATVADKIAFRDLRLLSLPLAKLTIKVNREAFVLRPASVFKLVWPDYEISQMVFRVARIGYGELDNGMIEIEAVQDVFSISDTYYGPSDDSTTGTVVGPPTTVVTQKAIESPYAFSEGLGRIKVFAAKPDKNQLSYNLYAATGGVTNTYYQLDSGNTFTPTGTLDGSYSAITDDVDLTNSLVITPTNPDTLNFLQNFDGNLIQTGENLVYITDGTKEEIIAFESVTYNSGTGKYTLSKIWRGLYDTVPQTWLAGARLWFFTYGESFPTQTYDAVQTVYLKTESINTQGSAALSTAMSIVMNRRSLRPYAPGKFQINGSTSTVNITDGSNIVVAWEPRNRITQQETATKQFATGIVAETGTEYYIKFFNASNTLLRTVGPLTTNTYTYTNTDQVADNSATEPKIVTVQLYSKREGLFSLYPQQRTLVRPSGTPPSAANYNPGTETYTPAPPDNAGAIGGVPVSGTPSNNQVLVYNGTNWVPSDVSSLVTLNGDVTGAANANTVVKIQNRAVASNAPTTNQVLGWVSANNRWEPVSVSSVSSGGYVLTIFSDVAENHTSTNTWEDVGDMVLAYTPNELSTYQCTFTCEIAGTSNHNEHIAFRFLLDGATASEVWIKQKDAFPQNNEKLLVTIHTAFENLTANTSHTVKVQWQDNGTNLDTTIYDRRFSLNVGKAAFDSSFTPDDVSGLSYWFKADALTGLSNNDPVNAMTDQTTQGNHFNATTSNTKGNYKTNQINGLPALQFNHDGNQLTTTNTMYSGPNFVSGYTEGEIFVVVKADADPAASTLHGNWSTFGSDTTNVQHLPYTDGVVYDGFGSNARKNTGNPTTNMSQWHLVNISSKANNWVYRIDGNVHYTTNTNTVSWTSAPFFGGNNTAAFGAGFKGLQAEVMVFNRVLNSTERNQIETYITAKYNI